jgi:hypothetical protein
LSRRQKGRSNCFYAGGRGERIGQAQIDYIRFGVRVTQAGGDELDNGAHGAELSVYEVLVTEYWVLSSEGLRKAKAFADGRSEYVFSERQMSSGFFRRRRGTNICARGWDYSHTQRNKGPCATEGMGSLGRRPERP